jgi:glycosyltransferase involved in cell wall biosynthesis
MNDEDDGVRILIANKYFFLKGGPERYLFNLKAILESYGHTVIPFSVRFARNEPTPYSRYFVDPPLSEEAVQLEQFKLQLRHLPRVVLNAFYSLQAKGRLRELIRRERIDLVYALNISNYLSPSIIDAAHAEGVPIVHRLSDFCLLCPSAMLNRPDKDRCFDCIPGKYWHGVRHRCVGGSLGASLVRCSSMFFHDAIRIYHRVDQYVCTTPFMQSLLVGRGFRPDRIHVIPTPIDSSRIQVGDEDDGTFFCATRLSHEKGVDVLVRAGTLMKARASRIIVVGEIAGQYAHECVAMGTGGHGATIEFLGPRYGEELFALLKRCRAAIIPSRWIDNLPNTLLEALAHGKPVIGANVEGINVAVHHGENGLLFQPNDPADLASKLDALANDPARARQMGLAGRRLVEETHNPERHSQTLMRVFETAMAQRRRS